MTEHHQHHQHHQHTPSRLDNPVRLAELNPEATLKRFGFQGGQVLCDIGAGSGIFTIPAARMTTQKVLALDINPEMLAAIEFHRAETPYGPPVEDRLDRQAVAEKLASVGFQVCDDFDLGPNMYGLVFARQG
jgi:2-polyprenyl-3-methyl-5-hydroxy-6-metoxy-1,4-benzoquinol methylase